VPIPNLERVEVNNDFQFSGGSEKMTSTTVPWKLPDPPKHPLWVRVVLWMVFVHWLLLAVLIVRGIIA
jgi:hypothetical protein